jgi:HEPN domain-containing protein
MELIEQWFKKAKSDLNVAKHSFENMHPKELDIVCIHCQQAVEKVLKIYLINFSQTAAASPAFFTE